MASNATSSDVDADADEELRTDDDVEDEDEEMGSDIRAVANGTEDGLTTAKKKLKRSGNYSKKIKTRNKSNEDGRFRSKWKENMIVMVRHREDNRWEKGKIVSISKHHESSFIRIEVLDSETSISVPMDQIQSRVREIDLIQDFLSKDVMRQTVYRMLKQWMSDDEKASIRKEFSKRESDFRLEDAIEKLFSANGEVAGFNSFTHRMITKDKFATNIIQKATGDSTMDNDPLLVMCVFMGRIIGIDLQVLLEKDRRLQSDENSKMIQAISENARENSDHFAKLECNATKVLLLAATTTCLSKSHLSDPRAGLFDYRGTHRILKNDEMFKAKQKKIETLLACIHSAQTDSLKGLGRFKLLRSLLLFLDRKGGVSDTLMNQLSDAGLAVSTKTLRQKITTLAESINSDIIREEPPPGKEPIYAFLFDNADFHLYQNCISMIVSGNIQIGYENTKDTQLMNDNYIKKLPKPDIDKDLRNVLPTKDDDAVAKHGIQLQNVNALIMATLFEGATHQSGNSGNKSDKEYCVGEIVQIRHRNTAFEGKVISSNTTHRTIEAYEGNGDPVNPNPVVAIKNVSPIAFPLDSLVSFNHNGTVVSGKVIEINYYKRTIQVNDFKDGITSIIVGVKKLSALKEVEQGDRRSNFSVSSRVPADCNTTDDRDELPNTLDDSYVNLGSGSTDSTETMSSFVTSETSSCSKISFKTEDSLDEFVTGRDDGGDRNQLKPAATTVVTDILCGISSKHAEATKEVMDRYIEQQGDDFLKRVHLVIADQEFSPSMFRQLFSSLETQDRMPLLLSLAVGHVHKNLVTSMLGVYISIFDELFKAQGIDNKCTKYKRILSGTNIRESIKWMIEAIETLRMAQAKAYLKDLKENPRKIEGLSSTASAVIDDLLCYQFQGKRQKCREGKSEVCLGIDGRPRVIPISKDILILSDDFEKTVTRKAYGGDSPKVKVGPSGYVHGLQNDIVAARSESLLTNAKFDYRKDNVQPEYRYIWDLDYYGSGDEEGLFHRCKNAGIIGNSGRRSRDILAAKYYLFKKHTADNNNDECVGRKAALDWNPSIEDKRNKINKDGCLTSITLARLLFGSEAYSLIRGYLLTRWQPERKDLETLCKSCNKKKKNCLCTSNHEWIVVLKATMHSCFSRNQKHYQKLVLNQLIHISCIIRHEIPRVAILALHRIYLSWVVSEKGDSFLCEPADLIQENRLVGLTKQNARKVKHDCASLTARVKICSLMCVKSVEASAKTYVMRNSVTEKNEKKMQKESTRFRSSFNFWDGLVRQLDTVDSKTKSSASIIGTKSIFRSKGVIFCRETDSQFYMELCANELIKAYSNGLEINLPPRPNLAIRRLDKEIQLVSKKRKRDNAKHLRKIIAKTMTDSVRDAVQRTPSFVPITYHDESLFQPLSECGKSKSNIFQVIMKAIKENTNADNNANNALLVQPDGPTVKPMYLTRNENEANEVVKSRRHHDSTPIILIVDFLKDLQIAPSRRGPYTYTLKELARDIIVKMLRKYSRAHVGILIFVMDVNNKCSQVRNIQRAKRMKDQNVEYHFNNAQNTRCADDLMERFGDFSYLMSNEKNTFVPMLAEEIVNQLSCEDDIDCDWAPSKMFGDLCLGFIGGSSTCCKFVGKSRCCKISSSLEIERIQMEEILGNVVNQGEGERMMISIIHRLVAKIYNTHPTQEIDTCFELHSDDSDVITSVMHVVHSLHVANGQGMKFSGSILVRARSKSAQSLMKIDKSFSVEGIDVDLNQTPTGKGFQLTIDPIQIYRHIEKNSDFESLPVGHRAIAVISFSYYFVNCDYIPPMTGCNYENIIKVFKSKEFKTAASSFTEDACSPIIVEPASFSGNDSDATNKSSINLSGALLVFTIAMMQRKKTNYQLKSRYTGHDYANLVVDEGSGIYDLVRAASLYVGESNPVPSPTAILGRLAAVNFIMQQMLFRNIYQDFIVPNIDENELNGTPFDIPKSSKIMVEECKISYTLVSLATKKMIQLVQKEGFNCQLREYLADNMYGTIFDKCQFTSDDEENKKPWPFSVEIAIVDAIMNSGTSPSTQINGDKLVPKLEARSMEELHQLIDHFNKRMDGKVNSQCINGLKDVFTSTLASRTVYNKIGSPLVLSNSLLNISRSKNQWDGFDWEADINNLKEKKTKDVYRYFGGNDHDLAIKALLRVCQHVFEHSCDNAALVSGSNTANEERAVGAMEKDIVDGDEEDLYDDDETIDLVSDDSIREEELRDSLNLGDESSDDDDSFCHVPNIIEEFELND